MSEPLGFTVRLQTDLDTAVARVTDALKAEGFGVLTEIDVQATLKKKIDVDFRPYKILGACNPHLAHRALTAMPEVGLLLPCNVTVAQAVEGTGVEVAIVNPTMMMEALKDNTQLCDVADEARAKLERVVAALKAGN